MRVEKWDSEVMSWTVVVVAIVAVGIGRQEKGDLSRFRGEVENTRRFVYAGTNLLKEGVLSDIEIVSK